LLRVIATAAAETVLALTVAMIEPSLFALLMAAIGGASLPLPGLVSTGRAAVAVSPVAVLADEEHHQAGRDVAGPLTEDKFVRCRRCRRHAMCRKRRRNFDWTNFSRRGTLEPVQTGLRARKGCQIRDLSARTVGSQLTLPLLPRLLQTQ
jgi:hypothetical protein